MNIEQQVCTLEQAKRLKDEFGISQKSLFHHGLHYNGEGHDNIIRIGAAKEFKRFQYAAFTVAELGVMISGYGYKLPMLNSFFGWLEHNTDLFYKSEAEARAAMLVYLLENHFITAEQVNNRLTNVPAPN